MSGPYDYYDDWEPCAGCDGAGELTVQHGRDPRTAVDYPCDWCGGTGESPR